jgi:hypothetical protein
LSFFARLGGRVIVVNQLENRSHGSATQRAEEALGGAMMMMMMTMIDDDD